MKRPLRRKSAFTLIELILAVGVVVMLTAVAIPSFSTLNRSNQWEDSIQDLASCVQNAQREAATPDVSKIAQVAGIAPTLRFTAAAFAYDGAGNVTCKDEYFADTKGVPFTLTDMKNAVTPTGTFGITAALSTVSSVKFSGVTAPSAYVVYFSASQGGVPVAYSYVKGGAATGNTITTLVLVLTKSAGGTTTLTLPSAAGSPMTVVNS